MIKEGTRVAAKYVEWNPKIEGWVGTVVKVKRGVLDIKFDKISEYKKYNMTEDEVVVYMELI